MATVVRFAFMGEASVSVSCGYGPARAGRAEGQARRWCRASGGAGAVGLIRYGLIRQHMVAGGLSL